MMITALINQNVNQLSIYEPIIVLYSYNFKFKLYTALHTFLYFIFRSFNAWAVLSSTSKKVIVT